MSVLTLGIDLGTSAIKALVMDDEGVIHASASAAYPTVKPELNQAEQSPAEWWNAVVKSCRKIAEQVGVERISAVGLSGQLNGIVLMDAKGTVLCDALIWLDQRGAEAVAELSEDDRQEITQVTGNPISPIAVLPKLRWLNRHRPALMASVDKILQVKDYILWRLTGVLATEANEASATLMMDFTTRDWSDSMIGLAGISRAQLPPIRPSFGITGHLSALAAEQTGLRPGTPVIVGAGDVGALAVGCGAFGSGVAAITLGTAGHVVLAAPEGPGNDIPGLWRMSHVTDDREIWLGLIMAGGLSIAWLRDLIGGMLPHDLSFETMAEMAAKVPAGARGALFFPFLEGAATPWAVPQARAAFDGFTTSHGAPEMIRAVHEGVAYNIRACLDAFEAAGETVERVHLAEGGARSGFWCQIIADVLGRPVDLVAQGDTSASGAAILAHAGISDAPLDRLIGQAVALSRTFTPDPANAAVYNQHYERFRAGCDTVLARYGRP